MAGTTAAAHRAEVDRKAAQLQAREAALEDRMERIRELESWMRNGSTGDLPFPARGCGAPPPPGRCPPPAAHGYRWATLILPPGTQQKLPR